MSRTLALLALLSVTFLAGCATCRRHPDGCAIAATVIAGAAIVAIGYSAHCSMIGPDTRAPACAKH